MEFTDRLEGYKDWVTLGKKPFPSIKSHMCLKPLPPQSQWQASCVRISVKAICQSPLNNTRITCPAYSTSEELKAQKRACTRHVNTVERSALEMLHFEQLPETAFSSVESQLWFKKVTHRTWTVLDVTQHTANCHKAAGDSKPRGQEETNTQWNNSDQAFPRPHLS